MSKPPPTPPSSDIDGVDRDRVAVDHPDNAAPDPGKRLDREEEGNQARPKDSRA